MIASLHRPAVADDINGFLCDVSHDSGKKTQNPLACFCQQSKHSLMLSLIFQSFPNASLCDWPSHCNLSTLLWESEVTRKRTKNKGVNDNDNQWLNGLSKPLDVSTWESEDSMLSLTLDWLGMFPEIRWAAVSKMMMMIEAKLWVWLWLMGTRSERRVPKNFHLDKGRLLNICSGQRVRL